MLVLIDNYDSFTYNLVHFLGELGTTSEVIRNDKVTADEVIKMKPKAIVLSPGPCTPSEAGVCLDLIEKAGSQDPAARRLPRASGHRAGLWRQGDPRAGAHARQALDHPPHRQGRVQEACPRRSK